MHKVKASLVNQTAPSAVLDVLHHQHAEGSGHCGTGRNVNMSNEISVVTCMIHYHITEIPLSVCDCVYAIYNL